MPADWIAIQRNPTSGRGSGRRRLLALVRELRRGGRRVRIFSRRERLDDALASPAARESLKCLVAAGGDGTVRDLVQRFPGVPIAVFPMGTENLLAKYLGMTGDPHASAAAISAGQTASFDQGEVNSRRFLLMLSVGFDADVVHRTDARRAGNITKWSYLQPLVSSLRKYEYPEIRVLTDGESVPLRGGSAVISNFPTYALQLPIASQSDPSDGLFDLRLFQNRSSASMMGCLLDIWRQRHESRKDVVCRRAASFRIDAGRPVPVQIDGDPAGFTPIDVRILTEPIRLIVPADFPRTLHESST